MNNGNDYWPAQMEHPQMSAPFQCMQQVPVLPQGQELSLVEQLPGQQQFAQPVQARAIVQQLQLQPQMPVQMPSQMPVQQPQTHQPMHMAPMAQGQVIMDGAPQASHMPQMHVQQMQMPQMQMSVVANGDESPTDWDRCMAIVMNQNAQSQSDKDMLAAQLKATADCQRYED